MKILIAPNALKGSLTAMEAALVIRRALPPGMDQISCPIADGGNNTLECLVNATEGYSRTTQVTGPFVGSTVYARWGVLGTSKTAVIEMAEAAGVHLLHPHEYDVAHATTRGVGELILSIIGEGYRKIIIGLGGSATHDCGTGCARALGVKFLDVERRELPDGGIALSDLCFIDTSDLHPGMRHAEIIALTDVTNPLTGSHGAASTFSPQKGADDEMTARLEASTINFENHISVSPFYVDTRVPGMGAAGGFAAGLAAFCGARLVPGIDFILDAVGADALLKECDIVVTAEGRLDAQTEHGKGIAGIASRARKFGKPVVAFVGSADGDPRDLCLRNGLKDVIVISPAGLPLEDAMAQARQRLGSAVAEYFSHY